MSPILLPRLSARTAAPILAAARPRRRSGLTAEAVKSERRRREKEGRQLLEETSRTEQLNRAGLSTDLLASDLSRPPL